MAIKYPEDRKRFIDDLRAAGLPAGRASSLELAELLGFSVSHIKNLFYGTNRYGSTTKDKLDALIAAKANGPEPVEQFEVDLPAESLLDQHVRKSTDLEVQLAKAQNSHPNFWIERVGDQYRVLQLAALCPDHGIALSICALLNKEGG